MGFSGTPKAPHPNPNISGERLGWIPHTTKPRVASRCAGAVYPAVSCSHTENPCRSTHRGQLILRPSSNSHHDNSKYHSCLIYPMACLDQKRMDLLTRGSNGPDNTTFHGMQTTRHIAVRTAIFQKRKKGKYLCKSMIICITPERWSR